MVEYLNSTTCFILWVSPSLLCCVHPSWLCVPCSMFPWKFLLFGSLLLPSYCFWGVPLQGFGLCGVSLASFTSDRKQYIQSQFNWIVLAYLSYVDHLADFLREFAATPHQIPSSLALPLLPPASHKRSRAAGALPAAGAGSVIPNMVHRTGSPTYLML